MRGVYAAKTQDYEWDGNRESHAGCGVMTVAILILVLVGKQKHIFLCSTSRLDVPVASPVLGKIVESFHGFHLFVTRYCPRFPSKARNPI